MPKPETIPAPTLRRSKGLAAWMRGRTTWAVWCALITLHIQAAEPSIDVAAAAGPVPRLWEHLEPSKLRFSSKAALVVDGFGNELYAKDPDTPRPIASITKLMTAMVVLDGRQDRDEVLTIGPADRDGSFGARSRLTLGTRLTREQLLQLTLMSSENRAAAALARHYRGGSGRFVEKMNLKAKTLRLLDTHFADPSGLLQDNVSTPRDLARMVRAAQRYPLIQAATTTPGAQVRPRDPAPSLGYVNTNPLVRGANQHWQIGISKTGYISAAGHCLVMQADIADQFMVMVLTDSPSKAASTLDANRLRTWLERGVAAARRAQATARKTPKRAPPGPT
jgi:D-alanyl-D-alanine endopeptidase (penicillin-binding protein 7)